MGAVNKVILVGNLGKDPEVKFTKTGLAVASFSIATTEKWKTKDGESHKKTEWHRISAWGKLGEVCGEYLAKGKQVYIEGKLQTKEWEDKEGIQRQTTEIVASNMVMLGQGRGDDTASASSQEAHGDNNEDNEDDDIPF